MSEPKKTGNGRRGRKRSIVKTDEPQVPTEAPVESAEVDPLPKSPQIVKPKRKRVKSKPKIPVTTLPIIVNEEPVEPSNQAVVAPTEPTEPTAPAVVNPQFLYEAGQFLAVLSDGGSVDSFHVCLLKQNVKRAMKNIKILWYEVHGKVENRRYRASYDDKIDFESILSNISVEPFNSKTVVLPEQVLIKIRRLVAMSLARGEDISEPVELSIDDLSAPIVHSPKPEPPSAAEETENENEEINDNESSPETELADSSDESLLDQNATFDLNGAEFDIEPMDDLDSPQLNNQLNATLLSSTNDKLETYRLNPMFDKKDWTPLLSFSVIDHSKYFVRAVNLNDKKLLRDLVQDPNTVKFILPRSEAIQRDPIELAIAQHRLDLLADLLQVFRAQPDIDQFVARNCREIVNSGLADDFNKFKSRTNLWERYLKCIAIHASRLEFEKLATIFDIHDTSSFEQRHLIEALRHGNFELVHRFKPTKCETMFSSNSLRPLHLAAAMWESSEFSTLVNQNRSDLYAADDKGWLPIHYAVVSKKPDNLLKLIAMGCSLTVQNHRGDTPLHLAIKLNRIDHFKAILESSCDSLATYNRKGFAPLHVACKRGNQRIVATIIKIRKQFICQGTLPFISADLSPLMIACRYGQVSVVGHLLDCGANISLVDSFNRTALTHAVMNGHSNVVPLLDFNDQLQVDILGNNLFHYALAYGWLSSFDILLSRTSCELKEINVLEISPVYAALLKGHFGLIRDLLKRSIIGVNGAITKSGECLALSCFKLPPSSMLLEFFMELVDTYHCDLKLRDNDGNNFLHNFIAWEEKFAAKNPEIVSAVFDTLLKHRCDPFEANNDNVTPILLSLQNECTLSFKTFLREYAKTNKFSQTILPKSVDGESGTDSGLSRQAFLMFVIRYFLEEIDPDTKCTLGNFFIMNQEQRTLQYLFKTLAFHTLENGDLPIEFFIRTLGQTMASERVVKQHSPKRTEIEAQNFFNFLCGFYDRNFLEEIHLLHFAAAHGCPFILNSMLDSFFFVNKLNCDGETPLLVAIENGCSDNVEVLLQNCRIEQQNIHETATTLFDLINHEKLDSLQLPIKLYCSLIQNSPRELQNTDFNGNTLLHAALRNSHKKAAKSLIKHLIQDSEFDIDALNDRGQTCLHVAFESKFFLHLDHHFVLKLVQRSSKVHHFDSFDKTPLHYICDMSDEESAHHFRTLHLDDYIKKIMKKGDPSKEDLVEVAIRTFKQETVALLDKKLATMFNGGLQGRAARYFEYSVRHGNEFCARLFFRDDYNWFSEENKVITLLERIGSLKWTGIGRTILASLVEESLQLKMYTLLLRANSLSMVNSLLDIFQYSTAFLTKLFLRYTEEATLANSEEDHRAFLCRFPNLGFVFENRNEIFLSALRNWNIQLCREVLRNFHGQKPTFENENQPFNALFQRFFELRSFISLKLFQQFVEITSPKDMDMLIDQRCVVEQPNKPPYYVLFNPELRHSTVFFMYSPLVLAIISNKLDIVRFLLTIKSDDNYLVNINQTDKMNRTPMIHAVLANNFDCIRLLLTARDNSRKLVLNIKDLKHKVNLLHEDRRCLTAFHRAFESFDKGKYQQSKRITRLFMNYLDCDSADRIRGELEEFCKARIPDFCVEHMRMRPWKNVLSKKFQNSTFHDDLIQYFEEFRRNQMTEPLDSPNVVWDGVHQVPYETVITTINGARGEYVKNFTFLRITVVSDKFLFTIRWGTVGTRGNISKTYFNDSRLAITEFEREFLERSKKEWNLEEQCTENQRSISCGPSRRIDRSLFDFGCFEKPLFPQSFTAILEQIIEWCSKKIVVEKQKIQFLTSQQLEKADEILEQILQLCSQPTTLEMFGQITLLNDEYYSILEKDNQQDKLKVMANSADVYDAYGKLEELKTLVLTQEFLLCAQKSVEKMKYFYDAFLYVYSTLDQTGLYWDKLQDIVEYSADEQFRSNFVVDAAFKIKSNTQFRVSKEICLWFDIEKHELIEFSLRGIQPKILYDYQWEKTFKAIKLTSSLDNGSKTDEFYRVLCCVYIDDVMYSKQCRLNSKMLTHKILMKNPIEQKSLFDFGPHSVNIDRTKPLEMFVLAKENVVPCYLVKFTKKYNNPQPDGCNVTPKGKPGLGVKAIPKINIKPIPPPAPVVAAVDA